MNRIALACMLALAGLPAANAQYERDPRYYEDRYAYQPRYDGENNDRLLHDQVHAALEDALGPAAYRIRVDVQDGRATLSGVVPDRRTRALAHDVAHDVPGIYSVLIGRLYVNRGYRGY